MPRFPVPSTLPNLRPAIAILRRGGGVMSATITGKDGSTVDITHDQWNGRELVIHDTANAYNVVVNFWPWPGEPPPPNPPLYPRYWSAYGFYVDPGLQGKGFGFQLYAYAKEVLREHQLLIAPSETA